MTNEEILKIVEDVPIKFWSCPDCINPTIYWKNAAARCCNCGKTNGVSETVEIEENPSLTD